MNFLKGLALVSMTCAGLCICVLALEASRVLESLKTDAHSITGESVGVLQSASGTLHGIDATVSSANLAIVEVEHSANKTLQLVNKPCVPGPCGTLADINKTLNTARGTMGQIEIAANHEDKNLSNLDNQEQTLFADTHKTLTDADSLVASPYLLASMHNLDTTSAGLADGAKQADGILLDLKFEADKLTHPPARKVGFWASMFAAGRVVQQLMPSIF